MSESNTFEELKGSCERNDVNMDEAYNDAMQNHRFFLSFGIGKREN